MAEKETTVQKSTNGIETSPSLLSLLSLLSLSLSECVCERARENDRCVKKKMESSRFFLLFFLLLLVDVFEKKKNLEKKGRPKPRNQEGKKERRKLVSLSSLHAYKNKRSTRAHAKGAQRVFCRDRERYFKRERERSAHISRPALKTRERESFCFFFFFFFFFIFPFLKSEKKIPFEIERKVDKER